MVASKKKSLTHKQERFVQEYLIDFNATQAYIRAGYRGGYDTARNNGSELLANACIKAAVDAKKTAIAAKVDLTIEEIFQRLRSEGDAGDKTEPNAVRVSAAMGLAKVGGFIVEKTESKAFHVSIEAQVELRKFNLEELRQLLGKTTESEAS